MNIAVSIAALLVFWIVQMLWDRLRSRRSYRKPDSPRITALEADAAARLKKCGREWLMTEDYQFQTRISSPSGTPLPEIERQLQSALVEILSHLHLLPNVKLIVTDNPRKLSGDNRMGEYEHAVFQKSIRLLVRPEYSSAALMNVLCHEATHYFMYSLGLNDPDPDRNEGLTEVMACLIGFCPTMLASRANRNAPYLTHPEFQQVQKLLTVRRQSLRLARDQARELDSARQQLRKNLAGARVMLEQARDMIAMNPAPAGKKMSRSSLARLQLAMLALETGSYADTIRQAEAALSGGVSAVREADRQVLSLCGDVVRIMTAFL